jgi:uncharacterized protein YjiS (DUF1127 family)
LELFMKKFYLATLIAVVVTTSIASHLLMVGALGPSTTALRVNLRSGVAGFFRRIGSRFRRRFRRLLAGWIGAMLEYRERRATIFALTKLSDRELRDIGVHRDSIAYDPRYFLRTRQAAASGRLR